MTHRPSLWPFISKELRELGPVWLGAFLLTSLGPRGLVVLAMAAPCLALGAMSSGHEFRRGTFETVLAQPIARWRIHATKMLILLAMLVTISISGWLRLAPTGPSDWLLWMPAVIGLCLAPLSTMAARHELGGAVLAGAIPALLWIVGAAAGVLVHGASPSRNADIANLQVTIFALGMTAIAVVGLVAGALAFRRFEAAGGLLTRQVRLVRGRAARGAPVAPVRRRGVLSALVRKELHLYGLPVAIAALFSAIWIAATSFDAALQLVDVEMFARSALALYATSTTLLVACLASAEERQLGTLPSELLLPISHRTRWWTKVGCAAAVTLGLVIVWPAALMYVFPSPDSGGVRPDVFLASLWRSGRFWQLFFPGFAGMLGLFALGLYASSLVTGGLRALLVSIALVVAAPAGLASVASLGWMASAGLAGTVVIDGNSWWVRLLIDDRMQYRFGYYQWMPYVATGAILLLILKFAGQNHGSLDQSFRRGARQALGAATLVLVMVTLMGVVQGVTGAAFRARWELRARREAVPSTPNVAQPAPSNGVPVPPR